MNTNDIRSRAERFRALHEGDSILVLPNAWDVASARLMAAAGAVAVGTTSMGVAAAAGYPDIQRIPTALMIAAVERMAQAIEVPLNADMEAGHGETTDEVVASIRKAMMAGAAGINIEDGTGDPTAPLVPQELLAERIAAIRAMAAAAGIPLVINARTDVFLRKVGDEGERLKETIARGEAYRASGADCVFVPGGLPREVIAALVAALTTINVVANPAISIPVVPSVPELQNLGVARVSIGSAAMRASLAYTRRAVHELLNTGTYSILRDELDRPEAQAAYDEATG